MNTRHFLKTLLIFTGIIAVGLVSIFLISYLGNDEGKEGASATVDIAK